MVTLVGAGPGDPMSLTLAGLEALRSAEVVVYDKLVHPRLLEWASPAAERLFVGKQAGHVYMPQQEINELLIRHAWAGRQVVRLKGGDPLIFGRGAEELEALVRAGVRFRVIAGVTAALGSAATAGIPLTHRAESSAVTFVTGHDDPTKPAGLDWDALARVGGTLVIYMARTKMSPIADSLLAGGMSPTTPIALVQWGGTTRQRIHETTLADVRRGVPTDLGTPMLAIVGKVVRYRRELNWMDQLPLAGESVLLLRSADQNEELARHLERLGAEVLTEPTMRIEPPETWEEVDRVLKSLDAWDWLVFTSRNGVRMFLDRLLATGQDSRALARCRLAAIGPGTAEELLQRYALRADLVPPEYRAESLVDMLTPLVADQRVLLVRADRGRSVLPEGLKPVAARLETVIAYRQVDVDRPSDNTWERLGAGTLKWVLLSSANIARGFLGWLDEPTAARVRSSARLVSISPVTSDVIRSLGYEVAVEATTYTPAGMAEAVVRSIGTS
jgi:uroporphyrinogen III methyltransferase/synthase